MHEMILLPSLGTVQGQPRLENRGENSVIIGQERNLTKEKLVVWTRLLPSRRRAILCSRVHVSLCSAAELVVLGIKHH